MKLSVDSKQRLTTVLLMCLEFYKVVMGTFLVVFVPQDCNGTVCSLTDNFYKDEPLNYAGNACNFITFASIGTLYFIEVNNNYVSATYAAVFMMIVNFVVSGFTVYQTYAGPNSITSFLSFFMLVSMKLYNAWTIGRLSIKDERANSAYMKEPKTYNTIDEDYRIVSDDNESLTSVEVVVEEKKSEESA